MQDAIPPESSVVPEKIQLAERWRLAGETLRRLAPELYDQLFAMIVSTTIGLSEESEEKITESYFMT